MQYIIWFLLAVFCMMPVIISHVILKNDEKN